MKMQPSTFIIHMYYVSKETKKCVPNLRISTNIMGHLDKHIQGLYFKLAQFKDMTSIKNTRRFSY